MRYAISKNMHLSCLRIVVTICRLKIISSMGLQMLSPCKELYIF